VIRRLGPGDESLLEAFLSAHADSSMFLRGNAREGGLVDRGETCQATYATECSDNVMTGVAAHCWNGMVLMQAGAHAAALARACVGWSGRPITGLAGPAAQVQEAREALNLEHTPADLEGDEGLYSLDLSALVVPAMLATGTVTCRPPHPQERDLLCEWRMAYDIEVLGATDSPAHRARSAAFLDAQIAGGNAWVATAGDALVSLSAFNAVLPDIVQLGGIYTPPELRGRGFAKAAVAASLTVARQRGASRAVLFTNNPSAVRTYEALGFRRTGDYSLVLLCSPSCS
jgi:GNAT superfamily N-acetyltransferase